MFYDTASRMTSETQTVSGVTGDFTLNYTYKPSGALASVEDPFDRAVSYSYDKTGQLSSVSGTNYPNVTNFISAIQYRAWGRAKSIAYGNGVDENTEFNERLQPTEYELADLRLFDNSTYTDQSTFDYYDDGRLYHSFYATGGTKFDRKFEYDFAGRIKEVYTGREAHDQSPLSPRDNPFRQSFQYDAFGNMTQRSGFLWRQAIPTDADTYTNNQRSEWSYDATGNVVYTESGGGAFDSAGQKTYATSSQTDDLGSGNYRMFDSIISQGVDGEGWFRNRTEYRYVEQSIGEDFDYTEDTTIQYFLWSSVLGAVVAELDSTGAQTTGFVFAGQRIAALEITPSSSAVYFRNVNPQTGTTHRTDYTGKGGRNEEFDPLGAQIPKTDPYITQNRLYSDLKPTGKLYMNDASPFSYDDSCSWDGIPTPCSIAHRAAASGAADLVVEADIYIKYAKRPAYHKSGKVSGALAGINQVWKGADARAAASGFFSALQGGLEAAINGAFRNVYISRYDTLPENNGLPKAAAGLSNYAHASPKGSVSQQSAQGNPTLLNVGAPGDPCQITVLFSGYSITGESLEPHRNGPGEINYGSDRVQGLGFTVFVTVREGGIGHIGPDVNENSPSGAWTVQQQGWLNGTENGRPISEYHEHDLTTASPYSTGDNSLIWYDHPGPAVRGGLTSYSAAFNFSISATNGTDFCGLNFGVRVSVGEHNAWSVTWREGHVRTP